MPCNFEYIIAVLLLPRLLSNDIGGKVDMNQWPTQLRPGCWKIQGCFVIFYLQYMCVVALYENEI